MEQDEYPLRPAMPSGDAARPSRPPVPAARAGRGETETPPEWVPNSRSHAGTVVAVLTPLTALAWCALGLVVLLFYDSRGGREGMAALSFAVAALLLSIPVFALTVVTASSAWYHRIVNGGRPALIIAVVATILALALGGFWVVLGLT